MAPMAITDFTNSERRTLAIVALALDELAPEKLEAAMRLLAASRDLDDPSMDVLGGALEVLGNEPRTHELLAYLCDERPLVDLQSEIWRALF